MFTEWQTESEHGALQAHVFRFTMVDLILLYKQIPWSASDCDYLWGQEVYLF